MNVDQIIRAVQRELQVSVDGRAGPETWQAIYHSVMGKAVPRSKVFAGTADPRSESVIKELQPQVAPYARALIQKAAAQGVAVKVISGFRSYAAQNALYAQGRTKPGRRVTNAKGGESNHNFDIAFDIGVFDGANYLGESPDYDVVGAIGLELGLDWGGNWRSFQDKPHYQLRPGWAQGLSEGEMLAELRRRVADASPIYA